MADLVKTIGQRFSMAEAVDISKNKEGKYYVASYADNIYAPMSDEHRQQYCDASGHELFGKACAVCSSSMLVYNMFSWICEEAPLVVSLDKEEFSFVRAEFEKAHDVLRSSRFPSSMDLVLTDEKKRRKLCIESKFVEYLVQRKEDMSGSYCSRGSYHDEAFGDRWIPVVNRFLDLQKKDPKHYWGGIKQSICHLIALNRHAADDSSYSYSYRELVFDPDADDFQDEHGGYNDYRDLFEGFWKDEAANGIPTGFMSYSDIWDSIMSCCPDKGRTEYLESRYMTFSNFKNKEQVQMRYTSK